MVATRAAAVTAGLLADRVLGEPPAGWHPVAGFGRAMQSLESRCYADRRANGVAFAAAGAGAAALLGRALSGTRGRRSSWWALASSTYVAVAGRALARAAADVAGPLRRGDLPAARGALPALVGRDPSELDEGEVARAVVESVAENTVDAVIAPAFWAVVAGPPGVLAYRAVNTLDAMVGHRSPRYARFGWGSARADDLAAWLPARVTAALVVAVRPGAAADVWRAVRHQAPAHPSPNAGVAEAAFAAAIGCRLGGTNNYAGRVECRPPLGFGPPARPDDIDRAVRLSRDVTIALAALAGTVALATRRRPA